MDNRFNGGSRRINVICFGDSNTYGYDPRSYLGGRYGPDSRWVDILAEKTGWTICNMGQNGREIPTSPPPFLLIRICCSLCWGPMICSRAEIRNRLLSGWGASYPVYS